jgi:hypothetical protein
MDAQKKFFVDTLGGTVVKFGANQQEVIKFPNVLIFFRPMQAPTGGTIGTTVNHMGFSVPDLRPVVEKIKANGFKMITRTEVAATQEVKDDIAVVNANTSLAFAMGPDDVKVEFVQVKPTAPIQLPRPLRPAERRDGAWQSRLGGGCPRAGWRSSWPIYRAWRSTSRLAHPSSARPAARSITSGSGQEPRGSPAVEADGSLDPLSQGPALNIAIVFIKDPWGTNIELTGRTGSGAVPTWPIMCGTDRSFSAQMNSISSLLSTTRWLP